MAVEFITPFSVFLFFLSSCQTEAGNYSEAQCKVLTVGEGTASEFRVKASDRGVRIVYLDLKFRNDSYRPSESENEFLPNRWVWASLISEPMLSLSYDYDILSVGLLKYQTRSMDVLLEDQPSGCLANLNSSYQNKIVGRALLNMTQLNSGEPPDRNVVCVAMIEDYFNDFLWSFFDGNVRFQCYEMSKEETTESTSIQCELDVQVSDSIFNLQEECKKEERRAIEEQSEDSHHRQGSLQRSRYGSTDEALVNVNAENSDSVPLVTLSIPTQSQEAYSQSLLYLDEPNPITFSYFLRNYTKERTELFSFHSKFAFLWYCVIPIFVYLRLGLNYIVESKFMKEVHKKPKASLVGPLFSYLFDFQGFLSWLMALAPLILILLSSPKDFLITVRGDIGQVVCPVCEENTVSVGEYMLRHLGTLAVKSYEVASYLINLHQKALAGSTKFFTHWAIEKMGPPRKRVKTSSIALWVLFWDVVLVIVVGVIFGGVCLCLLLLGSISLIILYSPWCSLILICFRKLRQMSKKWIIIVVFHLALTAILTGGCLVGGLSCRCITRMFGLVTLGLVLNASVVGPFLALSIVALTNIYLCYYNLQMRYRDVKEMISEKWQTLDEKREHGAVPEDLFWRICGGTSNSKNAVPPVRGEVNRMLGKMAIILIFLFLVFCSVFLVTDASSISAVPSTIAVFLSGAIPSLFFKGLTDENRFTGETKARMIREIEEAVTEYQENTTV
ncbi:uncharacterized protein [Pocillopora verrucosa]|uniref:uncharacterized protein isoform X2 n=1 Tax=Pocillopora verrucosa TaxID=203993 RepID=UPI003340B6FE